MRSSHKGIFQRTSKTRFPIKELMGPSISKLSETVYRPMEGELQVGLNKALLNFIDEAFKV